MQFTITTPVLEQEELEARFEWLDSEIGEEHIDWTWGLVRSHFRANCDWFSFPDEEAKVKFILKWL